MPKQPKLHQYSDEQTFERLLIAIATIIKYPGIGCQQEKKEGEAHQGLQEVQEKMREIAADLGRCWDKDYPAVSTIRKDFQTLKDYGILDQPTRYRWGYYLGTGGLDLRELSYALDALTSQAKYQADHLSKEIVQRVTQRLKGLNLERDGHLLYPVRQQIDSSIVYTDPIEMKNKQLYRGTLFEKLEMLETAILGRQTIEINRVRDPFGKNLGKYRVIPLQIVYSNIAWYLIGEIPETGHLFTTRLDRHSDYIQVIDIPIPRSKKKEEILNKQQQSLNQAHQLIQTGWGLNLGSPEEQKDELNKQLEFTKITVRFWGSVIPFIKEGEKRHPSQKIKDGKKDDYGQPKYVDYCVTLPPRSVNEFMFWVYRFMDSAQVIAPDHLVETQRKKAQAILDFSRS
jgi:hypothetical protein